MDFSQTKSSLSLGFLSSPSPPPRNPIADDSISLQLETSFRDPTLLVSPVPLQLMEPQTENHASQSGNLERRSAEDEEDDEREVEEFRILGHSMCLKRRRDSEPSSSSSSAAKRVSSEPNLEARRSAVRAWGNQSLCVADPDLYAMMESERKRQFKGLELIASENFVCRAVMEALGSHLTNKYSEGMAGARYYGGNQNIDEIETLCCDRALAAFGLDSENWGFIATVSLHDGLLGIGIFSVNHPLLSSLRLDFE